MTDLIVALLTRTAKELVGDAPLEAEDHARAQEPIPQPMLPSNYERNSDLLIVGRGLTKVVDESRTQVRTCYRPSPILIKSFALGCPLAC
jgi:hypothetical protein